jgi:hypothetical protein
VAVVEVVKPQQEIQAARAVEVLVQIAAVQEHQGKVKMVVRE